MKGIGIYVYALSRVRWTKLGKGSEMGGLRLSDGLLLGAAFLSFLASVSLWFFGYREEGLFVGLWVPSILSFGGYVKHMIGKG